MPAWVGETPVAPDRRDRVVDLMLSGVMLLWFILTALSVAFVAIDIRSTPESVVLKWGFVLVTLFTGPLGAFLYVLGCREPMPGLHAQYVATQWRQALGSAMHCVAGDGVGILAGAVIAGALLLARPVEIALEYLLGFGFGWAIFQALFMRDMVGGSYARALATTFIPELTSMNCLMAGMIPVAIIWKARVPGSQSPAAPAFWFIMSMALVAGFLLAYPMNWWLVARKLKHGMMTVRPAPRDRSQPPRHDGVPVDGGHGRAEHVPPAIPARTIASVVILSFGVLAAGITIGVRFA